jgi:hypothetical protein
MRGPVRRIRDWWERRRGRGSRLLGLFGGDDGGADGTGVREPRRPRTPSLSGAAVVDPPHGSDDPHG